MDDALQEYFICGGIPAVINEYKINNTLPTEKYSNYYGAIMGDIKKIKLKEEYSKQIIKALLQMYSTQFSWNELKKRTEIVGSHNTVGPYIDGFSKLYLANIVYQKSFDGDINYQKERKVYFHDPFLFSLFNLIFENPQDYFASQKLKLLNTEYQSKLAETIVYDHLCRFGFSLSPNDLFDPRTSIFFYRDSKDREIDFLLLSNGVVYPIEVKYQETINKSDYRGFHIFKKGIVISKNTLETNDNFVSLPLSIFLMLI